MKKMSEVALQTQWKGVPIESSWGTYVDMWWAVEMVQTSEKAVLEKQFNIVRMKSDFGRVMVNVVMKTIERMGRDMAQMYASLEEKLDPRLVDARLFARKPAHYWSEGHRYGPDWPFSAEAAETNATAEAETAAAPAEPPATTPAATGQL
jgi:hypothetical protein